MSTATLADNAPLDPDDELLVAYLDGELDRGEQTALESRLLDDAALRRRLQQLQTGWELLDELPNPAPSLKLVESTLELVVADVIKAAPRPKSQWSQHRWPIAVASLCLLGVIGSFVVVGVKRYREYRQQLEDLAVVENLDAYYYGSDLALMRQLFADPEWSNMLAASQEIGDLQVESIANLSATPLAQRDELLARLPLAKIGQLNARWERFNRFDEASREKIRQTAQAVAQQADAEYLLHTMQAYAVWRDRLPPDLRDRIESGQGKDRRTAIAEAIERTQLSISKRSSLKLDDDSIDWIYLALQQIVQQRIKAGDRATIDQLQRTKTFGGAEHAEYFTIASIVMDGGGMRAGGRRPFPRLAPGVIELAAPLQHVELETIGLVLPERALEILDSVAAGDPLKETTTIAIWAEEAVRRKFPFKRDSITTLERYNSFDESQRDLLDLLPPKEILSELAPDMPRFRPGPP
jgi:hypothetical protein